MSDGYVRVRWYVVDAGGGEWVVQRRSESTDWAVLGSSAVAGDGYVDWLDEFVEPETRYGYRLISSGGGAIGGETWVEVPHGQIDFAVRTESPVRAGPVTVSFGLSAGVRGKVTLHDISGRVLASRDVDGRGQREAIRLGSASLPPGLYFVRVEPAAATKRVVVIR